MSLQSGKSRRRLVRGRKPRTYDYEIDHEDYEKSFLNQTRSEQEHEDAVFTRSGALTAEQILVNSLRLASREEHIELIMRIGPHHEQVRQWVMEQENARDTVVVCHKPDLVGTACLRCNDPTNNLCYFHAGAARWEGSTEWAPHVTDARKVDNHKRDLTIWNCCGRNAWSKGCRSTLEHQLVAQDLKAHELNQKFKSSRGAAKAALAKGEKGISYSKLDCLPLKPPGRHPKENSKALRDELPPKLVKPRLQEKLEAQRAAARAEPTDSLPFSSNTNRFKEKLEAEKKKRVSQDRDEWEFVSGKLVGNKEPLIKLYSTRSMAKDKQEVSGDEPEGSVYENEKNRYETIS